MNERAMFLRVGHEYVGTMLTQGGWDPNAANGGTVLALIGHCLDEVPTLVPMTLSRFTADIHRPVPIGQPLRVESKVLREGKKIQIVELRLVAGDLERVRVNALRLRNESIGDGVLSSTSNARPGDALLPHDQALDVQTLTAGMPGFLGAVDLRRVKTANGQSSGTWVRLKADVVAGSPIGPCARLAATFDFANLIGMAEHPAFVTMINPDMNAHVLREPTGEWTAITGETRFNTSLGRGVSSATLSDTEGVFAFVTISQILQTRQAVVS
jgi:Thioesterase-like superfamily